ncbi:hypothetical protein JCM3765_006000 [Sporobolomyces pararoseus]
MTRHARLNSITNYLNSNWENEGEGAWEQLVKALNDYKTLWGQMSESFASFETAAEERGLDKGAAGANLLNQATQQYGRSVLKQDPAAAARAVFAGRIPTRGSVLARQRPADGFSELSIGVSRKFQVRSRLDGELI